MSGTEWRIVSGGGLREDYPSVLGALKLSVSTDRPDTVAAIEQAAERQGIKLERVITVNTRDEWVTKLQEEIEERLEQLINITEDPAGVLAYVERLASPLREVLEETEQLGSSSGEH